MRMRKYLLILLMSVSVGKILADGQDNQSDSNRSGRIVSTRSLMKGAQHAPANVDLLLLIEESDITIHFNGDFGQGTYLLNESSTGYTISNSIVASAGSFETIPFTVTETTSFNFYIEFEDGSWCQLSWND